MKEVIAFVAAVGIIGGFLFSLYERISEIREKDIFALNGRVLELEQRPSGPSEWKNDLVPRGAVVAFNLDNCPEGWDDFPLAYGRFIRGIDKGAKKIGSGRLESARTYSRREFL